jgi:hypothetical protein
MRLNALPCTTTINTRDADDPYSEIQKYGGALFLFTPIVLP